MNLLKSFEEILRIRLIEEKIADLYSEREMRCPVHLSIGQEAIAVGACSAITINDYAMSGHRSHAHYLAKGGSLRAMLGELYGKACGCCSGKGGSMHLIDRSVGFLGAVPIVGSTIAIATGTALTSQLNNEDRVTLVFFGDGATETGVFHESMNFASLRNLPVVFICENNFYSVYTPIKSRQPIHREIIQQALAHGMPAYQGDGNDVEEVYDLVSKAVINAKLGNGPTFLEFKTYRWREHCGPGYDHGVECRSSEEFEKWTKHCPLDLLSRKLYNNKLLTATIEKELRSKILFEIQRALSFVSASPFPSASRLTQDLFKD